MLAQRREARRVPGHVEGRAQRVAVRRARVRGQRAPGRPARAGGRAARGCARARRAARAASRAASAAADPGGARRSRRNTSSTHAQQGARQLARAPGAAPAHALLVQEHRLVRAHANGPSYGTMQGLSTSRFGLSAVAALAVGARVPPVARLAPSRTRPATRRSTRRSRRACATHHAYALEVDGQLLPVNVRMPGYPAFLAASHALFGPGFQPVRVAQAVVDTLTCLLAGALAALLAAPAAATPRVPRGPVARRALPVHRELRGRRSSRRRSAASGPRRPSRCCSTAPRACAASPSGSRPLGALVRGGARRWARLLLPAGDAARADGGGGRAHHALVAAARLAAPRAHGARAGVRPRARARPLGAPQRARARPVARSCRRRRPTCRARWPRSGSTPGPTPGSPRTSRSTTSRSRSRTSRSSSTRYRPPPTTARRSGSRSRSSSRCHNEDFTLTPELDAGLRAPGARAHRATPAAHVPLRPARARRGDVGEPTARAAALLRRGAAARGSPSRTTPRRVGHDRALRDRPRLHRARARRAVSLLLARRRLRPGRLPAAANGARSRRCRARSRATS